MLTGILQCGTCQKPMSPTYTAKGIRRYRYYFCQVARHKAWDAQKVLVGAIGVSGDSSCADHNIAWKTRHGLGFDWVPAGVSGDATRPDNIVYDIASQPGQMPGVSTSGWGHPACSAAATSIAATLAVVSH